MFSDDEKWTEIFLLEMLSTGEWQCASIGNPHSFPTPPCLQLSVFLTVGITLLPETSTVCTAFSVVSWPHTCYTDHVADVAVDSALNKEQDKLSTTFLLNYCKFFLQENTHHLQPVK